MTAQPEQQRSAASKQLLVVGGRLPRRFATGR